MKVTFVESKEITDHIKTLYFRADKKPEYTAGQYIQLILPHENVDDRGDKRWFTLSSSPTEDFLAITTKVATGQISTFKQHLFGLKPGDIVQMVDPMGDFVLPIDSSIPLTFVAGGIGITPMRSMVQWLVDSKLQRSIELIYAVQRSADIVFAELFQVAGIEPVTVISEAAAGYTGLSGRLTSELLFERTDFSKGRLLYLSGPEPMVETLFAELHLRGVPENQLVGDYFPNYSEY